MARAAVLVFAASIISVVRSKDLYVSVSGGDYMGCGFTPLAPCQSIAGALNVTAPGDVLHLDATGTHIHCSSLAQPLVFPLVIQGYNGIAHVTCPPQNVPDPYLATVFVFFGVAYPYSVPIQLVDLYFDSGKVLAYNIDLTVTNCVFENSTLFLVSPAFIFDSTAFALFKDLEICTGGLTWIDMYDIISKIISPCRDVSLTLINTTFSPLDVVDPVNFRELLNTEYDIQLMCSEVSLNIMNSKLGHRRIQVLGINRVNIQIQDTLFEGKPTDENKLGGLTVLTYGHQVSVTITNCTLHNLAPEDGLAVGAFSASALVKAGPIFLWFIEDKTINQSNTVDINNVLFYGNLGGITLGGIHTNTTIRNCQFLHNFASMEGSAMYVVASNSSKIKVENNYFLNCTSGVLKAPLSKFQTFQWNQNMTITSFAIVDGVMVIKFISNYMGPWVEGEMVASLRGAGGALSLISGHIHVHNCSFIDSAANRYGGSVKTGRDSTVTISATYFESSEKEHLIEDGMVLFSEGAMTLINVRVKVKFALNNASVVRHSAAMDNLIVVGLFIECPVGYHMSYSNSSDDPYRFPIMNAKYKTAVYNCRSCINSYFNDYGYINVSVDTQMMALSPTLILPIYTEITTASKTTCYDCPYGAKCDDKLASKINFWGTEKGDQVFFYRCPAGYCCTNKDCRQYKKCADHRVGVLCGECEQGYSEAMFSITCIDESQCKDMWLISLIVVVGLVYAGFLLLQKDLKDQVINGPLGVKSFIKMKNQMVLLYRYKTKKNQVQKEDEEQQAEQQQQQIQDDIELVEDEIPTINTEEKSSDRREGWASSPISDNARSVSIDSTEKIKIVKDPKDSNTKFMDPGGGFLVQIFYYFQDATILHVETEYVVNDSAIVNQIKTIIGGLFKFRLDLFHLANASCPFPGLTSASKLIFKILFVPLVLVILTCIYGFAKSSLFLKLKKKKSEDMTVASLTFLSRRAATGLMLAMMFSFQKLVMTSLSLLHCVPVLDKSVLFIQGSTVCYSYWQWITIAYTVICIIPFPIQLALGPALLRHGLINLGEFLLACILPLPFLITWTVRAPRKNKKIKQKGSVDISPESQAVCGLVQGPFREFHLPGPFKSVCWAGVLLGRRLVLIMSYAFISEVLTRQLVMFFTCMAVLVQHMYVLPYKDFRGNMAGTVSAAALLIVSIINLVRAAFDSAEYFPQGPNESLMYAFDHMENTLLLWIPLVGLCLILLVMMLRLVWLLVEVTILSKIDGKVAPLDNPEDDNREEKVVPFQNDENDANI